MNAEIPAAIGDFLPGARIAGYRIEQLIGRGGMAVVYRATDVRLDRMVALKILSPDLARNDSFRQRFIRESRAGAAVDHPHVIPVFEAGDAEGVLFIAMRYVSGLDVRALIERIGRLPATRTVELVSQVASALDKAHATGLVHRDVKPANMLLASFNDDGFGTDHVYLSDFGLSKQSISSPSLTMTGQFLGTLDYMSPEQVNGRQIDGKTDQYALGCAAFEMLTGHPPFRREANLAVMWAQVSAPPPSVRTARPELAAAVDDVIARALAKAPNDRYETCVEFALALRYACSIGGGQTPPVREPTELVGRAGRAGGPPGGVAGVGGAQAGAGGIEPTVSRAVPGGGYQGGVDYAPGTGPGVSGQGGPTGPEVRPYAAGAGQPGGPGYSGQGYGGAGYGGPAGSGPGYDGQASGPGGAAGPGGTQYGPGYSGGGFAYPASDPVKPERGRGLLVLLGVLIVVVLVGSALLVLHLRNSGNPQTGPHITHSVTTGPSNTPSSGSSSTPVSTPTVTPTKQSGPLGPASTVKAFFQAINDHNYQRAWNLNTAAHSISDYAQFKAGYSDTSHDTVTIEGVSGDTVSISLVADQTDGTVKTFSGSYIVVNGAITESSIEQTG
jgi:hypothetical protein